MRRVTAILNFVLGRPAFGPNPGRAWKVWDLDSELRYGPVLAELPLSELPICEVGSGPRGLAGWTDRRVIGIDPGRDDRHGEQIQPPPNLERLPGDGAAIPLPDKAVCAAVAVDTLEHVPRELRRTVVSEMTRVTQPGGRVILIGPTGAAAAEGDRRVRDRWLAAGEPNPNIVWLDEHIAFGLPTLEELASYFDERVLSVRAHGVFNVGHWFRMHRAVSGDYALKYGTHHLHHFLWAPFAWVARHTRRGPFYRYIVVAEVKEAAATT